MKADLYTENEREYKKVRVGKLFYKIVISKVLLVNGHKFYGFIDYNERIIYLLKDKDYKETLIHELTHAFIHEIYLNKKIKNKRIIKKLRSYEPFIEALSFLIEDNFNLK